VQAPGNNEAAGAFATRRASSVEGTCVVTADALHCHRGMAKSQSWSVAADYVLAVKKQPARIAARCQDRDRCGRAQEDQNKSPPRTPITAARKPEPRSLFSVKDMAEKHKLSRSQGRRADHQQTWKRRDRRALLPYDSALQSPRNCCASFENIGVSKNVLHWTLDVVLDEDQTRKPKKTMPLPTLPFMRRLALNIARAHSRHKKPRCGASSNARPGTTNSSSICS